MDKKKLHCLHIYRNYKVSQCIATLVLNAVSLRASCFSTLSDGTSFDVNESQFPSTCQTMQLNLVVPDDTIATQKIVDIRDKRKHAIGVEITAAVGLGL
jgi:hypothetical protein